MKRFHTIQKLFALCLIFSMALALPAGCAKKAQTPVGTISDFESEAHIQVSTPEGGASAGDTSREPPTGEFVVSEKKYDYRDANLMLLNVENQTNRHFNVTIHGTYLDENGNTIKEETQTFEAFPSGWSNHFIFYPKVAFDSFTYTVDTEEYVPDALTADESGTPYAAYIDFTYAQDLYWSRGGNMLPPDGDPEKAVETRHLEFDYTLLNRHPNAEISAEFHLLLLDTNGEIYLTDFENGDLAREIEGPQNVAAEWVTGTACGPAGSEDDGAFLSHATVKEQRKGEDETIPEEIQGNFSVIFAMLDVNDINVFYERLGVTVVR